MSIEKKIYGTTKEHKQVHLYTLKNQRGMEAAVSEYGAILRQLIIPDKQGQPIDTVLGYESLEGYFDNKEGLGAFIGRHANRIAGAKFTLNGIEYKLDENDGKNNLHSGFYRSHHMIYEVSYDEKQESDSITFSRVSPDMEQGFPGEVNLSITYTLTNTNQLAIEYRALSNKDTILNLTNHSYFNLNGHNSGTILDHRLTVEAEEFTPTDEELIPTGELKKVEGTPMDFRKEKEIGRDIDAEYLPLKQAGGYDHNYVLSKNNGTVRKAALLYAPKTGIRMEILTDMPGMQLYTGNFLENKIGGKEGAIYQKRTGVCFETQYFPNSCNQKNFPSCVIPVGKEYYSVTIFQFHVEQ